MGTKAGSRTLPDSYFNLVREFPLTHVRDDQHLDEAEAMIGRLLERDLDEGGQAYLDALTDLVEVYDDARSSVPDASAADVLRVLMTSNGLTQTRLGKLVGISQSTLSAVLGGSRSLTASQASTLASHFHVSPAVFLPG